MPLKIKLTVSNTDIPEYKSVEFGTYEIEFDIDEMGKIAPRPFVFEQRMGRKAGITSDNRLAFLDSIQIKPRVYFGKPIDLEDPLGFSDKGEEDAA